MAVYEGKWRCPRCGNVNPGRLINCASCSYKVDASVEYFLDDNSIEIKIEIKSNELLELANQDANWICSHCQTQNRAQFGKCSGCGNPQDSSDKRLFAETRNSSADWREGNAANFSPSVSKGTVANFSPPIDDRRNNARSLRENFTDLIKKHPVLFIIGIFFFTCCFCCRAGNHDRGRNPDGESSVVAPESGRVSLKSTATPVPSPTPRTVEIEVVDLEWTTRINIEEPRTFTETKWENDIPSDVKVLSRREVVRSYKKTQTGTKTTYESYTVREQDGTENYTDTVPDGSETYKCGVINKGNGFFEDKYCARTKYKTVTKTRPVYKNITKKRPVQEAVYEDKPVYDTQITYQTTRWMTVDSAEKKGRGWTISWANPSVPPRGRIGAKTEQYKVTFQEAGNPQNSFSKSLLSSEINNFTRGEKFTAKINDKNEILFVEEVK